MLLNHLFETNEQTFHNILKDFLPLAQKILELDELPHIVLKPTLRYGEQPTMGRFFHDGSNRIEIAISHRHPVDVLRTLAHEMVHAKQATIKHHLDPQTGSVDENQANEIAGIIMRLFNQQYPKYLSHEAL